MVSAVALQTFLTTAAAGSITVASIGYVIASIVINLAISALLGIILAPSKPRSGIDAKGIQQVVRNNVMPRRIIYGDAMVGGPYAVLETTGTNNVNLNMVVVLAGHPVDDILGLKIDDEYIDISGPGGATNDSGNDLDSDYWLVNTKYGSVQTDTPLVRVIKNNGWGYADLQYVTDGDNQEALDDRARTALIAADLVTNWGGGAGVRDSGTGLYGEGTKLTNCAHIYVRIKADRDVWSGFPKLKFHVRGKRLYNPYLDAVNLISEGADSAGTHDINDPDTYEWSQDWTLCVLDYLLNTSYGLGAKISGDLIEVDWAEAIQAHLDSSELVTNGLDSPNTRMAERYTINGVLETNATPISNMEALLTSGAGSLVYAQGKYAIRPGVYRLPNSPTDIINEDMIMSPLVMRTHTPRSEIFNKAAGVYVNKGYNEYGQPLSAANNPKFEPTDFPIVDPLDSSGVNPYEIIDGEEIIREFDFPLTTRSYEAQRLARIQLERVRKGLTINFEASMRILKYSVGDTVYLEILSDSKYANESFFNRLGLNDSVQNRPDSPFTPYYKQFKILDMQYTENSTISVSMIEEEEEIYEWNAGFANLTDNALISEIIRDDPTGVVLPPIFNVDSPNITITESSVPAAGTIVTTLIRWNAAERGSLINALDRAHISFYRVEYGEITDPSLVGAARVSEWLTAGNKASDHSQVLQGPMPLEALYKDGALYDFRVAGVTYSGRQSAWAYYSIDSGSDYNPSAPPIGFDGLTIYLTDVSGSVVTSNFDADDYILPAGAISQFKIFDGTTDVTDSSAVTYSVIGTQPQNGLSLAISDTIGSKGEITISEDSPGPSWTTDREYFNVRATYNGIDHDLFYTFSKLRKGDQGIDGADGADGLTGWTSDIIFSAIDSNTVGWTNGTITTASGTTYTIDSPGGNTGNMASGGRTYIYYDGASPSDTTLSTTTVAANAVGLDRILIAVAEPTGYSEAFFQVFGGAGGTLITGNEIVSNSILANNINATFYTGRQFTGGIFQTRLPSTSSPYDTTPRAVVQTDNPQIGIYSNDGTEPDSLIFGVSDTGSAAEITIVGDFLTGSLDTAKMYSSAGIIDLRGRLGVITPSAATGGLATLTTVPQTLSTSTADYELDLDIYDTNLDLNTLTFTIQDSDFANNSSPTGFTAPTWDLDFFYSVGSPHTWIAVPGGDFTVTGTVSTYFEPEDPNPYYHSMNLSAVRTIQWTPASPFAATDTIYYMIRVVRTAGSSNNPKLTACSASEAVAGGGVSALNDLSDVTITSPAEGARFNYDVGLGEWIDRPPLVQDVMIHGAVADGTTDDSAAFIAARDALSTTEGGIIYVPEGRYSLQSRVQILGSTFTNGGVKILMHPRAVIEVEGAATAGFEFEGVSEAAPMPHCSVEGGRIVGTLDGATHGIMFKNCAHYTVKDTSIVQFSSTTTSNPRSGLYVEYGIWGKFDRLQIDNCDYGYNLQGNSANTYRTTTQTIIGGSVRTCYRGIRAEDNVSLNVATSVENCSIGLLFDFSRTTGTNSAGCNVRGSHFERNGRHIKITEHGTAISRGINIENNFFELVSTTYQGGSPAFEDANSGDYKLDIDGSHHNISWNYWSTAATSADILIVSGASNNYIGRQNRDSGSVSLTDNGTGTIDERNGVITTPYYPEAAWELLSPTTPITDYSYPPGNVLRYGADPTNVSDSTAAFNYASRSDYQSTGITDLNFSGIVEVPAGEYRIDGTVYIHKGQHLRGDGEGASRINLSNTTAYTDHIFKMGEGEGGVDAGGLSPEISGLWIIGGPSSFAAIYSSASGLSIHNIFLTSVGTGIKLIGTDARVSNVQIDQCLTGIQLSGHSHIFTNILIYSPNYGVVTTGDTSDIIFDNMQLYFVNFYGVSLASGSTYNNIHFNNCIHLLNVQYSSFVTFFHLAAADAKNIVFSDSIFSNMNGPAFVITSTALRSQVTFNNTTFDGNKTLAAYNQSTTAYAGFTTAGETVFNNCEFRNLHVEPILTNGNAGAVTTVRVNGGSASNNGGTVFMNVSTVTPLTGSQLTVQGLWFKDEQLQPFFPRASWYLATDKCQVLTGTGSTTVLQFPSGRDSIFFIDTSTDFAQIYLPRSADNINVIPKHGDRLTFIDYSQDWGTNNVIFLRGDNTINGAASDYVASTSGSIVVFVFNAETSDWIVDSNADSTLTPWTSDIDANSFNLIDVDEVQGSANYVIFGAEDSGSAQPYAGYNIDMASSVATHLLTGAIAGVLYQNSGAISWYSGGSQTVGTTATPAMTINSSLLSLNRGLSLGSVVAASTVDLSDHIALYSTNYGLNITGGSMNLVANGSNSLQVQNGQVNTRGIHRIQNANNTDYADFYHDGTGFVQNYVNTTYVNHTGHTDDYFVSNVLVRTGHALNIYDSTNSDSASFSHNGTDFNTAFINTIDWNLTGLSYFKIPNTTSITALNNAGTNWRDMLYLNASDKVTLGNTVTDSQIFSANTPVWFDGTTTQQLDPSQSPINTQNNSYTFVISDKGKTIRKTGAGTGSVYTIPANASVAYPIGTLIGIDNQSGADITVAITTDVLQSAQDGTTGTQTLTNGSMAVIQKMTAGLWSYAATDFNTAGLSPINEQNGNYTCVMSDKGKTIRKASGGIGETFTIPANASVAYPIGTFIAFDNEGGGDLTIAITTDTLIWGEDGTTGSRTLADSGVACAQKVDTTIWKIVGVQLT